MFYLITTEKSFETAVRDLESAVTRHGFGVLHIHNLGGTLRGKGVEFKEECKIFEVCNPVKAAEVLNVDMRLNMALPCRVSVFTENGVTKIGMIKPEQMLAALSDDKKLKDVAREVEEKVKLMIDEAK